MQPFNTLEIPRFVRGKPHEWNSNIALRTAFTMLSFIYETLFSEDSTKQTQLTFDETLNGQREGRHENLDWPVFRISFDPGSRSQAPHLSISQLDSVEYPPKQGRVGILPSHYVQSVAQRKHRMRQKVEVAV